MHELIKKTAVWLTVGLLGLLVFVPSVALASTPMVEPPDMSLDKAKELSGAFAIVSYEESGIPIIARSITGAAPLALNSAVPTNSIYESLSDDAKEAVIPYWLINPQVGGAVDVQNTFITTEDTARALDDVSSFISEYAQANPEQYIDVQVLPVFSSSDDIMASYVFVGYRALLSDGSPVPMSGIDTSHDYIGHVYTGGSGYAYMAVRNGTFEEHFDYGKAEHSRKERHAGFDQPFDPVIFYGDESTIVNDERAEALTEETLPPGSSAVFLDHGNGGINSLQLGFAQANGENISAGSNGLMMALLPIILMGAILLIAMSS